MRPTASAGGISRSRPALTSHETLDEIGCVSRQLGQRGFCDPGQDLRRAAGRQGSEGCVDSSPDESGEGYLFSASHFDVVESSRPFVASCWRFRKPVPCCENG
jgi:hypothetical protein